MRRLLNWWWGLWVVAQMTGRMSGRLMDGVVANLAIALGLMTFSTLTLVFAGIGAISLLFVLRESQRAAAQIVARRPPERGGLTLPTALSDWLYEPSEPSVEPIDLGRVPHKTELDPTA